MPRKKNRRRARRLRRARRARRARKLQQGSVPSRSWYLSDAAVIAKENPYTFYKPSEQAIALLQVGDCVQLMFALASPEPGGPHAERMWVSIERIKGPTFSGTLENEPWFIDDLEYGTEVSFEACHIISVDFDDPVPDPTLPYHPRCAVSQSILSGKKPVGNIYREDPYTDEDSGWRILAGDESKEDLVRRHQWVSLGAVLRKDDSFLPVLQTPPLCAFVRDRQNGRYVQIDPSDMAKRIGADTLSVGPKNGNSERSRSKNS